MSHSQNSFDPSMDNQQLLEQVVMFYHDRLNGHAPAQEFLCQRSLDDPELIDRFQIGYADRALARALPTKDTKGGRELRERLTQLGILRATGHGHFNGCIVVPIRDANGAIIDLRGRKIGKGLHKGTPLDIQLPGVNGDAITDGTSAVVDESVARIVNQLSGNESNSETPAKKETDFSAAPSSVANGQHPKTRPSTPDTHPSLDIQQTDNEVVVTLDDRRWRVRGLEKNLSYERLKVNLMVSRQEGVHVDTFDLYSSRHRSGFLKAAAAELYVDEETVKKDLARLLLKLEELQDEQILATLQRQGPQAPEMTDVQRTDAMELLRAPNLVERIVEHVGLVGEQTNSLVGYIAATSRLLARPLAVMIQSSTASGKTTLMDAVLSLMPPEEQVKYSAMTGQSLYYMGQTNLKHKILAIAEEEGVAQASYALKLLQSEGKLTIASVEKEANGRTQTQTFSVDGPVMSFMTTTSEHPDPELTNRCFVVHVNEQADQTAAIHARQRAGYTLSGRQAEQDRAQVHTLHQNAQRLLERLTVVIPWADQLTFRADQTHMRRDHQKYLSLIASITLLHQHQRTIKTDAGGNQYVEATLDDIELAGRLASEALGQSLDSLMPQTRQLLVLIDDYVTRCCTQQQIKRSDFRFTQRQLREAIGWSDGQLRRNLQRLIELEYVLAHRTGYKNHRHYELLYNGQGREGEPFLLGLIDAAKLGTTGPSIQNGAPKSQNGASSAPVRRAFGAPSAPAKNGASTNDNGHLRPGGVSPPENGQEPPQKTAAS